MTMVVMMVIKQEIVVQSARAVKNNEQTTRKTSGKAKSNRKVCQIFRR